MPRVTRTSSSIRRTRDHLLVAEYNFCARCFRRSLKEWSGETPFRVNCVFDAARSKICAGCARGRTVCDTIPGGITGDAIDCIRLIRFVDVFWASSQHRFDLPSDFSYNFDKDEHWPTGLITGVGNLVRDLCEAFSALITAHRDAHGFPESRKKVLADVECKYQEFLGSRAHFIRPLAIPSGNASPEEISAYEASIHYRIVPSDIGWVPWLTAKNAFQMGLLKLFEEHFPDVVVKEDDESEDGEPLEDPLLTALLEWVNRYWPVVILPL